MEQRVMVARSATLSSNVCIGAGTHVGDNSRIANSVVGRDCKIGRNVSIEGCYIHDGVQVGANACCGSTSC
jgi:translation initiation factor eIF-2B subunit epsilon